MTLQQKIEAFSRQKRAEYDAVMAGGEPPKCHQFAVAGKPGRCGKTCTHVSKTINPAGYHDWACAEHAVDETHKSMWGSDPGWPATYETIEVARGGPRC